MDLTIKERIQLLGCLPQRGNILTLRIVWDLQRELALDEKEIKAFGVKEVGMGEQRGFIWDETKVKVKDVQIGEKAMDIIKEALKKLSDGNALPLDHMPLYERFVEGVKPEMAIRGKKAG